MFNHSINQVPQLGTLQRIIVKYAIRNAIEKLLLINLGRRKYLLNNFHQMKKQQYMVGTEIDIEKNIEKVKTVLIEICREVESDGTFEKLKAFIMENESKEDIQHEFLKDYAMNKSTVEYYENKLAAEHEIIKDEEAQMAFNKWILQQSNLNTIKENQITLRYKKAWEASKLDQLKHAIENEKRQSNIQYDRHKIILAREQKAAENLIDCYQSKISFLEGNLEYWTGEYERKMENIATDIHLTQDWINDLEKKIAEQEKVFFDYKTNIESYGRKQQRIHNAKKIQHWWCKILEKKRLNKTLLSLNAKNPRRRQKNRLNGPKNADSPIENVENALSAKRTGKKVKRAKDTSKKLEKFVRKF